MYVSLEKRELNGTRAWIFAIMNFIKIPVQIYKGNILISDLEMLIPASLVAVAVTFITEHFVLPKINQKIFEESSWLLVIVGAYKLATK